MFLEAICSLSPCRLALLLWDVVNLSVRRRGAASLLIPPARRQAVAAALSRMVLGTDDALMSPPQTTPPHTLSLLPTHFRHCHSYERGGGGGGGTKILASLQKISSSSPSCSSVFVCVAAALSAGRCRARWRRVLKLFCHQRPLAILPRAGSRSTPPIPPPLFHLFSSTYSQSQKLCYFSSAAAFGSL